MIDVVNTITCKEKNNKDVPIEIVITNHRNAHNYVVLYIEGTNYTVHAGDLIAAIKNATNVNR